MIWLILLLKDLLDFFFYLKFSHPLIIGGILGILLTKFDHAPLALYFYLKKKDKRYLCDLGVDTFQDFFFRSFSPFCYLRTAILLLSFEILKRKGKIK